MKEFKGSKGDWNWEENSASRIDGSTCIEVRGDSTQIAYLQSFSGWGPDHDRAATIANANLIAAAPDLLCALQEMVKINAGISSAPRNEALKMAQSAISKALGEE